MPTTNRKNRWHMVILVVLVLNVVGCTVARIGELNTETTSIELQEAEAVRAEIETSTGDLTLNLTGSWAKDLDVTIENAAGQVTSLQVQDAGVSVTVGSSDGDITANGFSVDGRS